MSSLETYTVTIWWGCGGLSGGATIWKWQRCSSRYPVILPPGRLTTSDLATSPPGQVIQPSPIRHQLRDSRGKQTRERARKSPASLKRDARVEPLVCYTSGSTCTRASRFNAAGYFALARLFVFLDCPWAERETARSLMWLGTSDVRLSFLFSLFTVLYFLSSTVQVWSGCLSNVTELWHKLIPVLIGTGAVDFSIRDVILYRDFVVLERCWSD